MAMDKLLIISGLVLIEYALTCGATQYVVGDNSGWDISTDLDTWAKDKRFTVGDDLLFQYSSSHSVSEVTKQNYKGCNTTNVLQSGSNGNTSFALSSPGDRYFICGNRLHCYAGMKIHVNVEKDEGAGSPIEAPKARPGTTLPPPSSKSNKPDIPSSAFSNHVGIDSMFLDSSLFGKCMDCLLNYTKKWYGDQKAISILLTKAQQDGMVNLKGELEIDTQKAEPESNEITDLVPEKAFNSGKDDASRNGLLRV
ncbi:unnamed protein product [Fraxinus pennsylvanica]|uniref:Phytocyanin domain-containing protein n=1 Tax=Fraxinus pennsylvanica TaxID=56036 RepID=A0AAD1ZD37_9LAMI|nr:unnamed protein product [Fraxinus pennsylvanica]